MKSTALSAATISLVDEGLQLQLEFDGFHRTEQAVFAVILFPDDRSIPGDMFIPGDIFSPLELAAPIAGLPAGAVIIYHVSILGDTLPYYYIVGEDGVPVRTYDIEVKVDFSTGTHVVAIPGDMFTP